MKSHLGLNKVWLHCKSLSTNLPAYHCTLMFLVLCPSLSKVFCYFVSPIGAPDPFSKIKCNHTTASDKNDYYIFHMSNIVVYYRANCIRFHFAYSIYRCPWYFVQFIWEFGISSFAVSLNLKCMSPVCIQNLCIQWLMTTLCLNITHVYRQN